MQNVSNDRRIPILLEAFQRERLKLLSREEEKKVWHARVMSLFKWRPQAPWPDVSDENLGGSLIKINYFPTGDTPALEVRLQEMLGLLETPTVNEGKIKVMLRLLSPGYKPVQVTQDLKSFWQTAYHEYEKNYGCAILNIPGQKIHRWRRRFGERGEKFNV